MVQPKNECSSIYSILPALEALDDVVEVLEAVPSTTRTYVRPQHMPFVCTRFRIFDQYLASNDPERFCEYTRLIPWEFEDLYESIAPELHYMGTHAAPISGRHRLFIYLRHVGFGSSSVALAQEVCCGRKTVSDIVEEVALAIIKVLSSDAFPTPTREMFEECASKTRARYDYPRAEGFLDGKHVRIKKPEHSGSTYWNYQNFFSIILLAVCDVDYRIIAYDVGAPGRAGDAGVFRDSSIKRFLDENDDLFPETRTLGNVGPVQFHVLVSGGFGQAHRYVRPYTQAEADNGSKRRFNTKHSRARRMIESVFGILVRRFEIFQKPMEVQPERAAMIVTSILIVHNLLGRRRNRRAEMQRFPPVRLDFEPLQRMDEGTGSDSAKLARTRLTAYYDQLYGPPS